MSIAVHADFRQTRCFWRLHSEYTKFTMGCKPASRGSESPRGGSGTRIWMLQEGSESSLMRSECMYGVERGACVLYLRSGRIWMKYSDGVEAPR